MSDLPLSPSQKVAAMMPRTMRAADSKRKKFFGPGFDLDAIEEGEKPSSPLVRRCVCSPAHGMHARLQISELSAVTAAPHVWSTCECIW